MNDIITIVKVMMKKSLLIPLGLLLLGALFLQAVRPAAASPQPQSVYFTPTPRPDGRIIYIVKENDTCISIALLNRITEAKLRELNNLTGANCIIRIGQELMLGLAGPAESPTPGPSPTPTVALPTPTPLPGKGKICVLLFEDTNGNGLPEETELSLPGGAVSLTDKVGKVSQTSKTTPDDRETPLCFEDIPEGEYNITVAAPQGYNPTTVNTYTLKLRAGDTSTLDFGAQPSAKNPPPAQLGEERSPLLGILGGLLILAGLGAGLFFWRMKR